MGNTPFLASQLAILILGSWNENLEIQLVQVPTGDPYSRVSLGDSRHLPGFMSPHRGSVLVRDGSKTFKKKKYRFSGLFPNPNHCIWDRWQSTRECVFFSGSKWLKWRRGNFSVGMVLRPGMLGAGAMAWDALQRASTRLGHRGPGAALAGWPQVLGPEDLAAEAAQNQTLPHRQNQERTACQLQWEQGQQPQFGLKNKEM